MQNEENCKSLTRATILSEDEQNQIKAVWNEDTPQALQRKFYHIGIGPSSAWWWRGRMSDKFLEIEKDSFEIHTGRIVYSPVFNETCQGGEKPVTQEKWLVENKINWDRCPLGNFYTII